MEDNAPQITETNMENNLEQVSETYNEPTKAPQLSLQKRIKNLQEKIKNAFEFFKKQKHKSETPINDFHKEQRKQRNKYLYIMFIIRFVLIFFPSII